MRTRLTSLFSSPSLLMLFALCFCFIYYGYENILPLEPQSVHMWRQADCASFFWSYYEHTLNLFTPRMNNLLASGNGQVAVEFPILYWLGGMIARIFGYDPSILRGINILVVFSGLFAFHRTIWLMTKDRFWSVALPVFLFSSPVLVYYTNNFLPDAPALALALWGWHFVARHIFSQKQSHLILAILFFTLATLLKSSQGINWVALGALWVIEAARWGSLGERALFRIPIWKMLTGFTASLSLILGWYVYAEWYSVKFETDHFLHLIRPITKTPPGELVYILAVLVNERLTFLYYDATHLLFLFLTGVAFSSRGRSNSLLFSINLLLLTGSALYFFLFFQLFQIHDYYHIVTLLVPAALMTHGIATIQQYYPGLFGSWLFRFLFAGFVFWNVYHAKMGMQARYYNHALHYRASSGLYKPEFQTYLDSLGATRDKVFISLPDPSPNITLYLMRREGSSGFGLASITPETIAYMTENSTADYMIITDPVLVQDSSIQRRVGAPAGVFEDIYIYKIKK